jgi:ATP-dependent protease ClpP protease subunit
VIFPRRPHAGAAARGGHIVNGPADPVEAYERFLARTRPTARVRPAAASWFTIRNAAESADVYIFDDIGEWGCTAQDLVDQLRAITAPQINLHINSRGGSCFDGFAIFTCLKAHPAFVHVYVDGLAASAASFIAQAGNKITIGRNAMMMVHKASGLCWGNAPDMRQMADLLDQLDRNIADIYAQRAGGTVEEWLGVMEAETWYSGAEAVAAGLADEMTDPDRDGDQDDAPAEMANQWDLSVFTYAGREVAPAPAPVDRGQAAARGGVAEPAPVDRLVGEHGVELVDLPADGTVVPSKTAAALAATPAAVEAARARHAPEADSDVRGQAPAPGVGVVEPPPAPAVDTADPVADDWAATTAAFTAGSDADLWADLTAHITDPAPSSPDDVFARLREALHP